MAENNNDIENIQAIHTRYIETLNNLKKRKNDHINRLTDENKKLKEQNKILVEYNNELQNKIEDLLKFKSNHICNDKCN